MKTRGLLTAPIVLVVTGLAFSVLTGGLMRPGMIGSEAMPMRGWSWGFGMGLAGLAMLAFWGALFVGLALLGNGKQKRDLLAT